MSNNKSKKVSEIVDMDVFMSEGIEQNFTDKSLKEVTNIYQSSIDFPSNKTKTYLKNNHENSYKLKPDCSTRSEQNKGNKQNSCKYIRSSNPSINKLSQEKNQVAKKQKQEIIYIKKHLQNPKSLQKEGLNPFHASEEIQNMKRMQKDCQDNFKEVQFLKFNLNEIRKNYQHLLNQKNSVSVKYNSMLKQNQQLTISISQLKAQIRPKDKEDKYMEIQEENFHLKEQIKKENILKTSIEVRCLNFQKRLNDYVLKYNETQQSCSEYQIKYYKLQKECDNLKLDKQQVETRCVMLQKQVKGQREVHQSEMEKLKKRMKLAQDLVNNRQMADCYQQKILKEKEIKDQQFMQLHCEITKLSEEHKNIKEKCRQQDLSMKSLEKQYKNEIFSLKEQLQHQKKQHQVKISSQLKPLMDKLKDLTLELKIKQQMQIQNVRLKESTNRLLQELNTKANESQKLRQQAKILSQQYKNLNKANKSKDHLQSQSSSKIQSLSRQLKLLEAKNKQLVNQNERIYNGCSVKLNERQAEKQRLEHLVKELKEMIQLKNLEKYQILNKINILEYKLLEQQKRSQKIVKLSQIDEENRQSYSQQIQRMESQMLKMVSQKKQIQLNHKNQKDSLTTKIEQYKKEIHGINTNADLQCQQKICFRQKYEKLLQEYNQMSINFSIVERQYSQIVKINASSVIQISTLKGQIINIQSSHHKNIQNIEQQSMKMQSNYMKQLQKQQSQMFEQHQQNNRLKDTIDCQETKLYKLSKDLASLQTKNNFFQSNHSKSMLIIDSLKEEIKLAKEIYNNAQHVFDSQMRKYQEKINDKISREMLLTKNIFEKEEAMAKIKIQAERQITEIQQLNYNLKQIEQNYNFLCEKSNAENERWCEQRYRLKNMCNDLKKSNFVQRQVIQESRLSISFELDTSQNALDILRLQNQELQKIYNNQIQKRNDIIKDLMKEKKQLYDSLMDKNMNN